MQSAYLSHSLGNTTVPTSRTPPIILTVMAFTNDSVMLQEQSGRKNIQINKEQIHGINLNQISKGDKLILLSSDATSAVFELTKGDSNASSQGKLINSGLADALRKAWPDIPADVLRRVSPEVLSKVQFEVGSQVGVNFADALVKIAKINQQPILDIKFNAIVKKVLSNSFLVQVEASNKPVNIKNLQLSLPLIFELKQTISNGAKLDIQLDASSDKKTAVKLVNKGVSLSNNGISELNKVINTNPRFRNDLDLLVSKLLFSNVNVKHHDVIIDGSNGNIARLPAGIQNVLSEQSANQPFRKQDSQLIVQPKLALNKNTVDITWLAKPLILKIDTDSLTKLGDAFVNLAKLDNINTKQDVSLSFEQNNRTSLKQERTLSTDTLLRRFLSDPYSIQDSATIRKLIAHGTGVNESPDASMKIDVNTAQHKKALLDALSQIIVQEKRSAVLGSDGSTSSLSKVLEQVFTIKQQAQPQLKMMLEKALPILNTLDNRGELDVNQAINELINAKTIKDIISASATQPLVQNQTNSLMIQLLGQSSSSGIINGLVKVLTATLLAKLNLSSSELGSMLSSFSNISGGDKKSNTNKNVNNSTKAIQELNRLDPQGKLFEQINALLSKHRLQKLTSIESTIQGNESLQYSLPNPLSVESKDIEIVIKKEQDQHEEQKKEETQTQWHLSMKLPIGKHGDALAKIKINNQNIALNFYASNAVLKNRIEKYLPLLNQRLEKAGLKIQTHCFVGDIPSSLIKTNLQMVHTYA